MYDKKIVTYSLLAHINDSSDGLKDLTDIFIPLIKRVLARLDSDGKTKGHIEIIRDAFYSEYGLKAPLPLLRKILNKIAREINKDDHKKVNIYLDGAYIIENFTFMDYDEFIKDSEFEIDNLQKAYDSFLKENNQNSSPQPCIFEFIDKNRKELISYFNDGSGDGFVQENFKYQVLFIEKIRRERVLFKALRKVYLGSIISCYIEYECFEEQKNHIELLLDTTFIIGLMDLRNQEDTDTSMMILDICAKLGHRVNIMDCTLREAENLLRSRADRVASSSITTEQDSIFDDFTYACLRKGLTKTDLQHMAKNLREDIIKIFIEKGIRYKEIKITEADENRVKVSELYRVIKSRPNNQGGALHDAITISWIRNERIRRRSNNKKEFFEVGCWLVTGDKTTCSLVARKDHASDGINPDHLANILWLSSPVVNAEVIKTAGLTRLISNTLDSALVKPKVFSQLKDNFKKYEKQGVTEGDILWISTGIANKALNTLDMQDLNEAEENGNFINTVQEKVQKAKIDDEIEKKKRVEIELEKENMERILKDELEKNKETFELEMEIKMREAEGRRVYSIINALNEFYEAELQSASTSMERDSDFYGKLSKQGVRQFYWGAFVLYVLIGIAIVFGCKYVVDNWVQFEPITYVISGIAAYIGIGLLLFLEMKFDIAKIKNSLINWNTNRLFKKYGINYAAIKDCETKIGGLLKNKECLQRLKEEIGDSLENYNQVLTDALHGDPEYKTIIDTILNKL